MSTPQKPSGPSEPSLEINLTEVESIARQLDQDAANEVAQTGPRRKKKKKAERATADNPEVIRGDVKGEGETEQPKPVVDEKFLEMITNGSNMGIDYMRDTMNLLEPGDTLRENVGKCLVSLVMRIQPMQSGPIADIVTLTGYIGGWILLGRIKTPPNDLGEK